jgi:hypothetical protein
MEQVWGSNPTVQRNLGGTRGDLALTLTKRRLISMAVVAKNMFHLWLLATLLNGDTIVPPESLARVPPGVQDILTLVGNNTSAIYVREPLSAGQDRIDNH